MRRGRRGPYPPMRDGARRDPLKRAAAAPPGDAGGSQRRRPPPPSEFLSRLPRAHLPAVRAPRAGTCEPPNRRRAIALRHRRRSASPLARARRSPAPFADRAASRLPPPLGDRCRTRTRERCAGRPAQPRIVFPISSSRFRIGSMPGWSRRNRRRAHQRRDTNIDRLAAASRAVACSFPRDAEPPASPFTKRARYLPSRNCRD